MVHADTIHKWLSQPELVSSAERGNVKEILNRYPYFVPARYLQAIIIAKEDMFTDVMQSTMRLYMANWLLYCEMLQKAGTEQAPIMEKQVVTEPVVEEPVATMEEPAVHDTGDVLTDTVNEEIKLEHEGAPIPVEEPVADVTPPVLTEETKMKEEPLIQPAYTEDYFRYEGIEVSDEIPVELETAHEKDTEPEDKSLLVMMSFGDWLMHFKNQSQKAKEEEEDKRALKTMWQKEKLAAALEEENEEIPELVFEMAVNSIEKEEDLASESLADILVKQKKYDKAIDMYRKLSLRNPQKSAYFASQIEKIQKGKES